MKTLSYEAFRNLSDEEYERFMGVWGTVILIHRTIEPCIMARNSVADLRLALKSQDLSVKARERLTGRLAYLEGLIEHYNDLLELYGINPNEIRRIYLDYMDGLDSQLEEIIKACLSDSTEQPN